MQLNLSSEDAAFSRLASGVKSKIGYAGKFVADQAVQLHGGMGMTDELNIGHYFKRISSINIQFGDPAFHVLRFAQLEAAA
jgi:alkylation response protein AidB-like acyl-CoA dehydrogenase